jgi:S-adenosylmethionine:tRNA ribosyltransferase-isomerase
LGVALNVLLHGGGATQAPTAATEPPEARGLRRDEVRLMIAGDGPLRHRLFTDLGRHLAAGDLLVVNTSATLPAALDGEREDGSAVAVHVSGPVGGHWAVELRRPGGGRVTDAVIGERLVLAGDATAQLRAAYPDPTRHTGSRLWEAMIATPDGLEQLLHGHGRPITYDYLRGRWPLTAYQTIFAADPGSAEMPSAGRPFSAELVVDLVRRGVVLAPVTLHTGVSSPEAGEAPLPERYRVPQSTADLVAVTRAAGRRVIAVGTTVTRALETVARADESVTAGEGWTDLVLDGQRPARVVDGLITGWHDADASHLQLLQAVAGAELVAQAYDAARAEGYRWHEFGDACLLLRGGT